MKRRALTLALLALAACGKKEDLRPAAGYGLPQKPASAPAAPTTAQLLTPSPEARPERNAEQIRHSQVRKDDPFDLPPK